LLETVDGRKSIEEVQSDILGVIAARTVGTA
jgi:hypothetical protein